MAAGPAFFNFDALIALLPELMDGHIIYQMKDAEGRAVGKVSDLTCSPDRIAKLDCSGLVEYVFFKITTPSVNLASGSFNQMTWFRAQGHYLNVPYADAARRDSTLRLGYRKSTPRRKVAHIWFIINGRSIESTEKGGADGPASLSWDVRTAEASECLQLGPLLPMRFDTAWIPAAAMR